MNGLFELTERMDYEGNIVTPLDQRELNAVINTLKSENVESVAVSFLFSFRNPEHEQWVGKQLRAEGFL